MCRMQEIPVHLRDVNLDTLEVLATIPSNHLSSAQLARVIPTQKLTPKFSILAIVSKSRARSPPTHPSSPELVQRHRCLRRGRRHQPRARGCVTDASSGQSIRQLSNSLNKSARKHPSPKNNTRVNFPTKIVITHSITIDHQVCTDRHAS